MSSEGSEVVKYLESMPQYKKDRLAAATLDLFNRIVSQPGGRELIERKKAELRAQGRL